MTGPAAVSALAWLVKRFGDQAVLDESLSRHTSFRIGGPADALVTLDCEPEIAELLQWSQSTRVPVVVLGNGTNVLSADSGFRGVVLRIAERHRETVFDGSRVLAPAGCSLARVAGACASHRLGGLEFAAGIPGSLGGAVSMNAGAWGGSISDVLVSVRGLDRTGVPMRWTVAELGFSYRHSRLLEEFIVITEVELSLMPRPREDIVNSMRGYAARRRVSQPLDLPSAGSVFRNPPEDSAGRLIDAAGCKGLRVGDAVVSRVHANFIVNAGRATAQQVTALIVEVRERVARTFGVALQPEITFLGEFAPSLGHAPRRSVE